MALCERVAGTAFEVPFKVLSLYNRLERNIKFDLPWNKPGTMGTLAGVMIRESLAEVRSMTSVTFAGMT